MSKRQVFLQPLPQDWARALLESSIGEPPVFFMEDPPSHLQDGFRSVAEMLAFGRNLLEDAVGRAQRILDQHPLTQIVADAAAREAGQRGPARLIVDPGGIVMLEVNGAKRAGVPKRGPSKGKLPTLDDLRARAKEQGVDISDLGRAKKKILERLKNSPTPDPDPSPAPPRRKRIKRAEALTPAAVLTIAPDPEPNPKPVLVPDLDPEPDEPDVGDDDTVADETAIQQAVEAKVEKPKVDMAALVSSAGDLDLDSILATLDGD